MQSCVYLFVGIYFLSLIINSCSTTTEVSTTTLSLFEQLVAELRKKNNELVRAREQLRVDREKFEEVKRQMQGSVDKTDVIRLNVGGELMMTRRETLTRVSKSVLATMFNGRWEHKLSDDQDGNIFLDFDPTLFRHLLDQLRVSENIHSIMFDPPSSSSLAVPFNKMLRKLGLDSSSKSSEAVITFDVGGQIVTTRHKILSPISNSKLVPPVSSSNKTSTGANGHLFLDCAPNLFRHFLGQLREEKTNTSGFNASSNEEKDSFNVMLSDLNLNTATTTNSTVPLLNDILHNSTWAQNAVTVAGGNGEGDGLNQLKWSEGLFVDANQTVVIADYDNHRVVEWKSGATSGEVVAGGNGQGNRTDQLYWPTGVIVDKQTDSLIICDRWNRRVVRWPRRGGTSGQTIISDVKCYGLAMDNKRFLYVSDPGKNEVRRWRVGRTSGTVVAGGNGQGDRLDQLSFPTYIFVDRDHSVYVSDSLNNRVMKWVKGAKEGIVVAGDQGEGDALTQLNDPAGVVVDQLGTVYVADYYYHRIMRWPKGATEGSIAFGGNDQGKQANQLSCPEGLSFDRQGNLYVVDYGNHRVQRFQIEMSPSRS